MEGLSVKQAVKRAGTSRALTLTAVSTRHFFRVESGANGDVSALVVQSDGKIVICGDFTTVNGTARNRIARLNSDGTLDFTFLATGSGANFAVNAAAFQSDGKIVIGGRFTTINGTTRNRIARLNSDGTLDASFLAAGSGVNGDVFSLALQSDGKTVIGGFSPVSTVRREMELRVSIRTEQTTPRFWPRDRVSIILSLR